MDLGASTALTMLVSLVRMIEFSDIGLPLLERIHMEDNAFLGDHRDDRKTILTYPYNYDNRLIMEGEIEWER